jgi:hypothetical protein
MRIPNKNSVNAMFGDLPTLRNYAAIVVEFGGELTNAALNDKNLMIRRFFKSGRSLNWTDREITKLLLKEVLA